jgi:hypothetical protein
VKFYSEKIRQASKEGKNKSDNVQNIKIEDAALLNSNVNSINDGSALKFWRKLISDLKFHTQPTCHAGGYIETFLDMLTLKKHPPCILS